MLSALQMKYCTSIDSVACCASQARPISDSSPFSRMYAPDFVDMRSTQSLQLESIQSISDCAPAADGGASAARTAHSVRSLKDFPACSYVSKCTVFQLRRAAIAHCSRRADQAAAALGS